MRNLLLILTLALAACAHREKRVPDIAPRVDTSRLGVNIDQLGQSLDGVKSLGGTAAKQNAAIRALQERMDGKTRVILENWK